MTNVTTDTFETTDVRDHESIARADQYGSETITLAGFNPDGYIDKNESGIWHVIIREEPTHPIPEKRVVLDACPRDYWSGLNVKKHAELTTRGYSWTGDAEASPREFRFTYVDRYELVDRLISVKTGEWTCVFRRIQDGNGDGPTD